METLAPNTRIRVMTREERAARRTRSEWPVRLYHALHVLITALEIDDDVYHDWLRAKRLIYPTPQRVKQAEQREARLAATTTRPNNATMANVSAQSARKVKREKAMAQPGVKMWDKLRLAVTAVPK